MKLLLITTINLAFLCFTIGQEKPLNDMKMKIAVWDTYVKIESGEIVHFDVLVPDEVKDSSKVFSFGYEYLKSKNWHGLVDTKQCQFCHIEEGTEAMIASIKLKGYDIIEMETIPVELQKNPTRRQMILYLRGHFNKYRFADFKGKSENEIMALLAAENINIIK